jgi:ferrous iron transport protein B
VNFLNLDRNEMKFFTKSHRFKTVTAKKKPYKRYQFINDVLKQGLKIDSLLLLITEAKLDRVLTTKFGICNIL